jgi:hypothetical protein
MRPPGSVSRRVLLTATTALGLHDVRATAGWGGHAHGELDAAHAYLTAATWTVVVVGALLIAQFLFRLATPPRFTAARRNARRGMVWGWVLTSVTLAGVCLAQELLEHLWVAGSLPSPDVLLATGGWTAIPLAALLGAAVTVTARGSDAALTVLSGSGLPTVQRILEPSLGCRVASAHPRRNEPLAGLAAGRAPPAASVLL